MAISLGINWKDVNPLPQTLPQGEYTFTLLGGSVKEGSGRLVVSTVIKDGEFAGKPFTFTYPDFNSDNGKWAIPEFKRLIIALGDEPLEGESEPAFLTRMSGSVFGGRIKSREYTPVGADAPKTVADLVLGSVHEAV